MIDTIPTILQQLNPSHTLKLLALAATHRDRASLADDFSTSRRNTRLADVYQALADLSEVNPPPSVALPVYVQRSLDRACLKSHKEFHPRQSIHLRLTPEEKEVFRKRLRATKLPRPIPQTLRNYLSGRSVPSSHVLAELAKDLNVNPDWLAAVPGATRKRTTP